MKQEIKLKIIGMHCTACAMNIDGALEDAGVQEAKTSFAKQELQIKFDDSQINLATIKAIVKNEGYEVE